jgi:hypothetical protein
MYHFIPAEVGHVQKIKSITTFYNAYAKMNNELNLKTVLAPNFKIIQICTHYLDHCRPSQSSLELSSLRQKMQFLFIKIGPTFG